MYIYITIIYLIEF